MHCTLIALAIVCSGPSIRTTPAQAVTLLRPSPAIVAPGAVALPERPASIVMTPAPSVRDFPPTTRGPLDGSSYTPGPWRMDGHRDPHILVTEIGADRRPARRR